MRARSLLSVAVAMALANAACRGGAPALPSTTVAPRLALPHVDAFALSDGTPVCAALLPSSAIDVLGIAPQTTAADVRADAILQAWLFSWQLRMNASRGAGHAIAVVAGAGAQLSFQGSPWEPSIGIQFVAWSSAVPIAAFATAARIGGLDATTFELLRSRVGTLWHPDRLTLEGLALRVALGRLLPRDSHRRASLDVDPSAMNDVSLADLAAIDADLASPTRRRVFVAGRYALAPLRTVLESAFVESDRSTGGVVEWSPERASVPLERAASFDRGAHATSDAAPGDGALPTSRFAIVDRPGATDVGFMIAALGTGRAEDVDEVSVALALVRRRLADALVGVALPLPSVTTARDAAASDRRVWLVGGRVAIDDATASMRALLAELDRLTTRPTDAELARARRRRLDDVQQLLESAEGAAGWMRARARRGIACDAPDEIASAVDATSADAVHARLGALADARGRVVVFTGDARMLGPIVEALAAGPVDVVTMSGRDAGARAP